MSAFDHLTIKAYHEGKRAPYFRNSAKKHAIIAMVLAIVTGIAWFVLGWGWALVPFAVALFFTVQTFSALNIAIRLEDMEKTPI
jgi:hypothetical protein